MARSSFADLMSDSKVMLRGLQKNADSVATRGIDAEFITNMQNTMNDTEQLNGEQEALKASLKAKTAELDNRVDELKDMMSEARKVVKLAIKQEKWVEFGIKAKR